MQPPSTPVELPKLRGDVENLAIYSSTALIVADETWRREPSPEDLERKKIAQLFPD